MILAIFQTPQHPPGYPATEDLPADGECFIGTHAGSLPRLGETFRRYGREWRIVESKTIGDPRWTFRVRATASP